MNLVAVNLYLTDIIYSLANRQGLFASVRTCKTLLDTTTKFMVVVTSLFKLVISSFPDNMSYLVWTWLLIYHDGRWFQQRCSCLFVHQALNGTVCSNTPVNNHVQAGQLWLQSLKPARHKLVARSSHIFQIIKWLQRIGFRIISKSYLQREPQHDVKCFSCRPSKENNTKKKTRTKTIYNYDVTELKKNKLTKNQTNLQNFKHLCFKK